MRETILIVLSLVTLFNLSCDNYEISDKQADSFLKSYGAGMKDMGLRVISTEEGYLIMGYIDNPGRSRDICIIQTDKYGNSTQPIITHGGLFEDNGYAIKRNNEGYIIAGSTRRAEFSDKDIYLLQIGESGEFIWDSTYGGTRDDEAYDVVVLENGNLVITGYSDISDIRKRDVLFLETDMHGTELKMDCRGTFENDEAFAIVKSNKAFMIAGYSEKLDAGNMQIIKNIVVFRWTGEGTPDVNPFENVFPSGTGSEVRAIISNGINEYYLACNVQESQTNETSVAILKIDTTLFNIIWQKSYGERSINVVSDFSVQNNTLYACGTSTNESGTSVINEEQKGDFWVLKASIDGENPQYYYMGDGTSYKGNGFDHTSDGGYIITGANFTGENSFITLCKLNADGQIE